MHFTDINGITLSEGQRVAWATVANRGLATGLVVDTMTKYHPVTQRHTVKVVRVKRESDGRVIDLPYDTRKFVVIADAGEVPEKCCECGREVAKRYMNYGAGGYPYCDACLEA